MTIILHIALFFAAAATSWLALLLSIATLIHGRAWVWAQTRDAWRRRVQRRSLRHRLFERPLRTSGDQPVAFTPRGGWL